jgi:DNA-binding NtrC family response regulator
VDLLFTDVLMPGGADGLALAMAAAERWPALPVLFTTGYSPNAIIAEGGLDSRCRVIGKPYSFDALARKVRECLDGAAGR